MGEVLKLRRPRKETIRGAARGALTEAMQAVWKPGAVVIVALSADGSFALRTVRTDFQHDFDVYARAESVIFRQKNTLID